MRKPLKCPFEFNMKKRKLKFLSIMEDDRKQLINRSMSVLISLLM
jgi:hypothetical protein